MPGSGSLGRLDLQPSVDLSDGMGKFSVTQAAIQTVQEKGLLFPGLPTSGYRGEMPQDITSQDDEQLGDLLNNISQWIGYIEGELAKAEGEKKSAQALLDYVRARVRLTLRQMGKDENGVRLTDKDKTDWMECEPRVIDAEALALYWESVYRITMAIRDKAQRDWESVSRRITQRGQDVQRQVRNGNLAGVPVQGPSFRRRSNFG